jgi:hypothetical protein
MVPDMAARRRERAYAYWHLIIPFRVECSASQ